MTDALSIWFAYPSLLAMLAMVPLVAVCFLAAFLLRRRALARLGTPSALQRLTLLRPARRGWRACFILGGLTLLALACAGPQWGKDHALSRSAGGDLVVVLDLSRSMGAEQPSRLERALRQLHDLMDTLQQRGQQRVALVIFAAQPRLFFPLTQDYDHFRHVLRRIEEGDYAPLVPGPDEPFVSGTRIGAALELALQAQDETRAGRQAILLLSDGDDPADDEEWRRGVTAAQTRHVPVHVVGIGDPHEARPILNDGDLYRYQGEVVRSPLEEDVLQEIARRTGGTYLPAHTHALPLGTLVRNLLEQPPSGEDDDTGLLVYRQRYAWFLTPALLLLVFAQVLGDRPRRARPAAAALVLMALVGVAPLPSVEEAIRRGNAAFAERDFESALQHYEQAETVTTDPGLVAFNRAAALFRLERYAEAANSYRCCLDDDQAPPTRRARAYYDLGNALVRQAHADDAATLAQAVSAFRSCLLAELDDDLRADARHNLELAQLLWLKARAQRPNDQPENGDEPMMDQTQTQEQTVENGADQDPGNGGKQQPDQRSAAADGTGEQTGEKSGRVQSGPLLVLPDQDELVSLPTDQAEARLAAEAERIARQRRLRWQQRTVPADHVKDW